MGTTGRIFTGMSLLSLCLLQFDADAQERIKTAYSSVDASNKQKTEVRDQPGALTSDLRLLTSGM